MTFFDPVAGHVAGQPVFGQRKTLEILEFPGNFLGSG